MKKLLLALRKLAGYLALAVLVIAAVGYYQNREIPREQLPPLSGRAIDGRPIDLRQLTERGPVLVYFWATWCVYCRGVSSAVSDLSSEYQVISVALQSGNDAKLLQYQKNKSLEFSTLNDLTGALSHNWGVRVTPTLVIVGSDGEVSWVTSGLTSRLGLELRLAMTE